MVEHLVYTEKAEVRFLHRPCSNKIFKLHFILSVMKTDNKKMKCNSCYQGAGCVYGLGFIGAVVYYISTATSFWGGVLGVLKAIVWPGFLVYELLKFLGA